MSNNKELDAKILRYHFVEHWGVNTIADQLGIHHTTVDRVLCQAGMPKAGRTRKASIVDPYHPLIIETLEQYPRLSAARLFVMAQERGYTGGSSQFRAHIAWLRPRKPAEAYLRLRTLPGEQGQVDWAHFGHVQIGRAKRALMAFVMVLSWSRQIFVRFYLNARMGAFLHGHVAAFEAWGGMPRVLLYDNLRSAVLNRRGDTIEFNPVLLDLAAHYRFEPRPVAVARGNEKGRVERSIRYIRENFFAARQWSDIDDLNAQARAWYGGHSSLRPCPQDSRMTVGEAFESERTHLLTLPDNPFPAEECVEVRVAKTPYIRFDLNDYSVPHTRVQRTLTVRASLDSVRVFEAGEVVAEHVRTYGKGEQVEDPAHIEALVNAKRAARHHRGQDRLAHAAPSSTQLLGRAVERGNSLNAVVRQLEELLDTYGASELEQAVNEALQRNVPHPDAVRQSLVRRREQRRLAPPIAITLTHNDKARNIVVRGASLAAYDQLNDDAEHPDDTDTPTDTGAST